MAKAAKTPEATIADNVAARAASQQEDHDYLDHAATLEVKPETELDQAFNRWRAAVLKVAACQNEQEKAMEVSQEIEQRMSAATRVEREAYTTLRRVLAGTDEMPQ